MKLYTELAPWWPLVSPPSEYAIEAAGYRQRLEENAEPPLDTVLELGCGGGNNASFLKRRFAMTLSDASAEMLAVSRARNPECEHVLGDMGTSRHSAVRALFGLESGLRFVEAGRRYFMGQMGFYDLANRYAGLDAKNEPLVKIDEAVPWEDFRGRLEAVWRRPDKARKSRAGRKPWDAVVMFKMIVLCALYNLSDDQVEHQIRDRLLFMRFLGLGLEDRVPDAKTVWLYREQLTQAGVIEALFERFDGRTKGRIQNCNLPARHTQIGPCVPGGVHTNDMGGTLVRSVGLVRAKARIGLKNLAYNMRRLVPLERLAAAV